MKKFILSFVALLAVSTIASAANGITYSEDDIFADESAGSSFVFKTEEGSAVFNQVAFDSLDGDLIKVTLIVKVADYSSWNKDSGFGGIYAYDAVWSTAEVQSTNDTQLLCFDLVETVTEEANVFDYVFAISDIKAAVGKEATGFSIAVWGDAVEAIEVYVGSFPEVPTLGEDGTMTLSPTTWNSETSGDIFPLYEDCQINIYFTMAYRNESWDIYTFCYEILDSNENWATMLGNNNAWDYPAGTYSIIWENSDYVYNSPLGSYVVSGYKDGAQGVQFYVISDKEGTSVGSWDMVNNIDGGTQLFPNYDVYIDYVDNSIVSNFHMGGEQCTYTITKVDFTLKDATVVPDTDSGIDTAIAEIASDVDAVEVARYNLAGQKIAGEQKGINIIKYSDGSSKKVLVK